MTIDETLVQFIETHLTLENRSNCQWWVGYSGGLDSHLLLLALSKIVARFDGVTLHAVHVNHQLQDQALGWEKHCQSVADQLAVPLSIERVNVDLDHSAGLEAAAREARYGVFKTHLSGSDVLFLAHHQDDQAETLLLRLMRGSGATGLAAMAALSAFENMLLARPLLNVSRDAIEAYAQAHQLKWVEDPSNDDRRYDRNYVRSEIMPLLKSRWPAAASNMARSAELLRMENQQMDLLLAPFYEQAMDKQQRLDIRCLKPLPEITQGQLIRGWLKKLNLPYPSRVNLQRILREVIAAPIDGKPLVRWGVAEVRRYEHWLYGMPVQTPLDTQQVLAWDFSETLVISGLGCLVAQVDPEHEQALALRKPVGGEQVSVRFRQGGEKCRPSRAEHQGKAKTKALKKLMHDYQIPPWLRDRTPLIYYDDQLAAVLGGWVCDGFAAPKGQAGYCLTWTSD
ncbi:MAG: tRNA lysidine(34) synthetase TilS [Gammaproteobacteria bacterium]|nr:MAG: tRNA lysidine(34) synthetase TilS [Gammaproteobacteria bacterium]